MVDLPLTQAAMRRFCNTIGRAQRVSKSSCFCCATSSSSGNGGNGLSSRSSSNSAIGRRSEEHTSELQSLMRISYAVFCLKKKRKNKIDNKLVSIVRY